MDLDKEIEEIGKEKIDRIASMFYSIGLTKVAHGGNPLVPIGEFKYLVGTHKVPSKKWYIIVKYLERIGIGRYEFGSRFVLVKLSSESLAKIYSMQSQSKNSNPELPAHRLVLSKRLRRLIQRRQ